ncbi:hypothetical protein ACJ5NV_12650 [Loktanella agnita]|uniref:hypothetical protein n=1 Tax=Loktanella agnita TaxID=287097 RepID=UPI0039871748
MDHDAFAVIVAVFISGTHKKNNQPKKREPDGACAPAPATQVDMGAQECDRDERGRKRIKADIDDKLVPAGTKITDRIGDSVMIRHDKIGCQYRRGKDDTTDESVPSKHADEQRFMSGLSVKAAVFHKAY